MLWEGIPIRGIQDEQLEVEFLQGPNEIPGNRLLEQGFRPAKS